MITKEDSDDEESEGTTDESGQDHMVEGIRKISCLAAISQSLSHSYKFLTIIKGTSLPNLTAHIAGIQTRLTVQQLTGAYQLLRGLSTVNWDHSSSAHIGSDDEKELPQHIKPAWPKKDPQRSGQTDYNGPQAGCTAVRLKAPTQAENITIPIP